MKKYIVFCLLTLFLALNINAQYKSDRAARRAYKKGDAKVRKETVKNADFIFEGVIKKISVYERDNIAKSSYIVDIKKVFKGNLKIGTVEIIAPSQLSYGENRRINERLNRDTLGIFTCKIGGEYPYNSKYNIDSVDNKIILKGSNPHSWRNLDYFHISSKTKGSVYRYLWKFKGVKVPFFAEKEPEVSSKGLTKADKRYARILAKQHSDSVFREREKLYKILLEKRKMQY